MSEIQKTIERQVADGKKAMGIFVTSGYPNLEDTVDILLAIANNGADFVELGMPFSDPLAEGTPIQRSSEKALSNGLKMDKTLEYAKAFSEASDVPLILMGYINPLMRYGLSNFCEKARSCGVKGLIIPDLPPGESGRLSELCKTNNLDLIHLIAPNTSSERVLDIDAKSSGFVYAVSITGLTGSALDQRSSIGDYLASAKSAVKNNPLLVGFGIDSNEKAQELSKHVDGFIVGSAVIRKIEELWSDDEKAKDEKLSDLGEFVHLLKFGKRENA